MKFASFENIVAAIYNYLPGTKNDYGKGAQTLVAFSGGYLAGILCAIVSHPADVMVSKLNADRAPGEAFGSAMSRIYAKIGFGGLWNGLPVRIVMIGTLTGLQVSILNLLLHAAAHISAVDDLRLIQDLCRSSYHWFWWRETDCQSIENWKRGKSRNDEYMYVRLGLTKGRGVIATLSLQYIPSQCKADQYKTKRRSSLILILTIGAFAQVYLLAFSALRAVDLPASRVAMQLTLII